MSHKKDDECTCGLHLGSRRPKMLTDEEFIQRLVKAGWSRTDAEAEMQKIKEGYYAESDEE